MNSHTVDTPSERSAMRSALPIDLGAILAGSPDRRTTAEDAVLRVRVISQGGVPRWVVPEDTRRAVAVLKTWKPYKLKSRLKWSAIVALCRVNALRSLPGVGNESLNCDLSYWREHLPGYSNAWAVVAYVGSVSPTRKAILFFVDEKSNVRAVAKTPIIEAAKASILNEANILKKLEGRLALPRVLFSDEREGIAAQTWMEGVNVSRSFGAEQLQLLTCLALDEVRVRMAKQREELEKRSASTNADLSLLGRALALLDSEEELRACVEHGDFAPWNLRRLGDGRLTVLDWEWAREEGYPWQDVCRYFYMQDYLFQERCNVWKKLMAHAVLAEYRQRFELSDEAVRGLTAMYLLRRLCDDYDDGLPDRVEYAAEKLREIF
ncbi:MAG TPA: phosphotransferase [Silvibacterium sp.]|nr:phosphotransferase [Silvibacterium sp.]